MIFKFIYMLSLIPYWASFYFFKIIIFEDHLDEFVSLVLFIIPPPLSVSDMMQLGVTLTPVMSYFRQE